MDDTRVPVKVWLPAPVFLAFEIEAERRGLEGVGALLASMACGTVKPRERRRKPRERRRKPLTAFERTAVLRLHAQGLTDGQIARRIGRRQQVTSRLRGELGLLPNGRPFGGKSTDSQEAS